MLNKSKLIHRRKQVIGGKVVYSHHRFRSGGMIQVSRVKHLGRVHIRPHHRHAEHSHHTGAGSKRSRSHAVHSSILKSLSKRTGGTLCRY